jgi:hypothetical protein
VPNLCPIGWGSAGITSSVEHEQPPIRAGASRYAGGNPGVFYGAAPIAITFNVGRLKLAAQTAVCPRSTTIFVGGECDALPVTGVKMCDAGNTVDVTLDDESVVPSADGRLE